MTRCHWCQKRATTEDSTGKPLCGPKCKLAPLSEKPAKRRTTAKRRAQVPGALTSRNFVLPSSPLGSVLKKLPMAAHGRWEGLIRMLKMVEGEDETIDAFVKRWDKCPKQRRVTVTPEDLLAEVGIGPAAFIGKLAEVVFTMGRDTSRLISACAEPLVVEKLASMAQTDEGFNDRRLFLQSSGFAPSPQTSIHVAQDNRSVVSVQHQALGLPDMSADAVRFTEIIRGTEHAKIESPSAFLADAPVEP